MKKIKKPQSKKGQQTKKEATTKRRRTTNMLQAAFLAAYSGCGRISRAAKVAKVCRDDHYRWMKGDPTYPKRFEAARQKAIGFLEDVAIQRATEGWLEPVFYKGEETGAVRKFSDLLLIFTLKGNHPEKYRERIDNRLSGEVTQVVKIITSGEGKPKSQGEGKEK